MRAHRWRRTFGYRELNSFDTFIESDHLPSSGKKVTRDDASARGAAKSDDGVCTSDGVLSLTDNIELLGVAARLPLPRETIVVPELEVNAEGRNFEELGESGAVEIKPFVENILLPCYGHEITLMAPCYCISTHENVTKTRNVQFLEYPCNILYIHKKTNFSPKSCTG